VREQTVKNQLSQLYRKVGVRNRLELGLAAPRVLAPGGADS
jgi:DNA-binding NarL/FixJ family response regulator